MVNSRRAYRSCISGASEMQVNKSRIYRQDPTSTNICRRPVVCCCQGKVGDGEMISDKRGGGAWRGAAWEGEEGGRRISPARRLPIRRAIRRRPASAADRVPGPGPCPGSSES